MPSRPPLRSGAAAGVAAALLAGGCTGGAAHEPALRSFAPGPCRQAASAVVAVDRVLRRLKDQQKPRSEKAALAAEQQQLLRINAGTDGQANTLLKALVVQLGLLRIAVDTDDVKRPLVEQVSRAQQVVVRHCTGAAHS